MLETNSINKSTITMRKRLNEKPSFYTGKFSKQNDVDPHHSIFDKIAALLTQRPKSLS